MQPTDQQLIAAAWKNDVPTARRLIGNDIWFPSGASWQLSVGSVSLAVVTDVSQRLLAHHGGLRGLFRLDVAELALVRGLGDAKSVRLKAALDLGRRLAALFR